MKKWTLQDGGDYYKILHDDGTVLGYSKYSGLRIIEEDGLAFKDLNGSGVLEPYKDWRLPFKERAEDLARKMTVEQIAGLMLYSGHQAIPGRRGFFGGAFSDLYDGKAFEESGAAPWALSDGQKHFLQNDHLRHILVTMFDSPDVAARWNNAVQAYTEGLGLGIPVNISSDPRHGADADSEYNAGAGGSLSQWTEPLGLAATFDPALVKKFGSIAAKEYRALGIATALSPQIDMATDPRWMRFNGTFGESAKLAADMARAYCDGFQTSEGPREIGGGWGYDSVNAMVKHWPGGGTGEAGRDAHFGFGKYAVYPGGHFDEHLIPFTEGAFKLEGKTAQAAAVMPYYTISYGVDQTYHENVGNAYSRYIITDLLRNRYGYDGVVCTDWAITADSIFFDKLFSGKCWGVETLSVAERHYKILMAGVDQFGGNNEVQPVLDAYALGVAEHGEAFMRRRFEASAVRLLMNIFRTGLFENPYLDPQESTAVAGCEAFVTEGYNAQLKSIVLLKNKNEILPVKPCASGANRATVYIPDREIGPSADWFGNALPARKWRPVRDELVQEYFNITNNPAEADFALVFMDTPVTFGYEAEEGYVPISLQYRPYTAEHARETSLTGGDPHEQTTNRAYNGKTIRVPNEKDLDILMETHQAMGGKPVVVSLKMYKPVVANEFEPYADAIIANFGVQPRAVLDILSGKAQPEGLLPFRMPADMKTVETQYEDVPFDMEAYTDESGNAYDFAFGLNWHGVIKDGRTQKYGLRQND